VQAKSWLRFWPEFTRIWPTRPGISVPPTLAPLPMVMYHFAILMGTTHPFTLPTDPTALGNEVLTLLAQVP